MITEALILVTDPQRCLEGHAGLPLLKRTVLSAQKGGVERFIIAAGDSVERLKPLLSGDDRIHSTVYWSDGDNLPDILRDVRSDAFMIIKAESVFDSGLIRKMARGGLDGAAACVAVHRETDGAGRHNIRLKGDNVVECGRPSPRTDGGQAGYSRDAVTDARTAGLILAKSDVSKDIASKAVNGRADFCEIIRGLLDAGTVKAVDVTDELCMEVNSREAMLESERKMYRLLGLATDSPFSIYVSRRLSRMVSGVFVKLPVTPNQITLLSLFVGLMSCWFFLQGGYRYSVLGVTVFYASVILDLVDGEVARVKYMYSRYGGVLDSICDSIVYSGAIFCIALALHRSAEMPHALAVGAVAAGAMFLCSNLDFYLHFMESNRETEKPNAVLRIFANEDHFLVALIGFTVFDKLSWYIWAVAAGCTVYTCVLIAKLILARLSVVEAVNTVQHNTK